MNLKRDKKFVAEAWTCPACRVPWDPAQLGCEDTQDHVVRCEAYRDLRANKDLGCDRDLVEYFRQVIERRSESQ